MAATVNSSKAFDLSGASMREDLEDIIYDISPMDTWFLNNAGRGRCTSTTHEWQTDSLTAPAHAPKIEGDAYSANPRVLPSRLKNYTQINRKEPAVSGTAEAVEKAGMDSLMAYHLMRGGKEMKRDMETTMLGNTPAVAGSSTAARVSAGVANWVYELNHIKGTGQTVWSTTAPVSGFATGTIPGASTTAMVETDLQSALGKAWSCGGEIDTILTTNVLYNKIGTFTGIATRMRNVESGSQAQIIGAADTYVSAYGSHRLRLSRYILAGSVYCLDIGTWAVAYLRPFKTTPIAKISDEERSMLVAEWTLVAKSPRANAKVHGLTA